MFVIHATMLRRYDASTLPCYDVGWSADGVFLKIYVGHHQKTPESVGRCRGLAVKALNDSTRRSATVDTGPDVLVVDGD